MPYNNIPYKSFCWSFGTTSYRTKNFNLNIERQLSLLFEFWNLPENADEVWSHNNSLQTKYYDFMKMKDFVIGDAPNKSKDAREKTSGLVDIGLVCKNRKLTEVGIELLRISLSEDFASDNALQIPKDSFIYLKQLLKTTINVDGSAIRPFIILLFLLSKLEYLTQDEYTYLLPLCINRNVTDEMPQKIRDVRNGILSIDEIVLNTLMGMDNYQSALALFLNNEVSEELFCTVGFNRKSRSYDKPYYYLYCALREVCLNNNSSYISEVYESTSAIKIGKYWRKYLFNKSSARSIISAPVANFRSTELSTSLNEIKFKTTFFKIMHLFKAKATLCDYLDLNRRYMKNTDTVLFEDNAVKLDLVPKQFFNNAISSIYKNTFEDCDKLFENCQLTDIAPSLVIDEKIIINGINGELGANITTMDQARQIIENERYRRLENLITNQFTDETLLQLLEMFEERDDAGINRLVTDNADIPTIFEYILGIIWYKVSEKQGKILDYMKLSLEADLLPKTHAGGGEADIVYEYPATDAYPEHALQLEATLANANNQRSMEMEPVSRHLGQYVLRTHNQSSYCVFTSNYLNINVISDFRNRRSTPFYDTRDYSRCVDGMKIIPIQTSELKTIIKNGLKYKTLYPIFEEAFCSTEPIPEWYNNFIAQKLN